MAKYTTPENVTNIVNASLRKIPDFQGATSSANGAHGLVPSALPADINKFLKADGTWGFAGGGANAIIDTIYEGTSVQTSFTVSKPYTDYDLVFVFVSTASDTSGVWGNGVLIPATNSGVQIGLNGDSSFSYEMGVYFTGPTSVTIYNNFAGGNIFVQSIVGIKFCNPNVYSTTEQRIGTWIDGKPLYQKTFTGTTGTMTSPGNYDIVETTHANLSSLNIDKVAKFDYVLQSIW